MSTTTYPTRHWLHNAIGPRRVGGIYRSGYWAQEYKVLAIDLDPEGWMPYAITVRWDDGRETVHCTDWDDGRDSVIYQPKTGDAVDLLGLEYVDLLEDAHDAGADLLYAITAGLDAATKATAWASYNSDVAMVVSHPGMWDY